MNQNLTPDPILTNEEPIICAVCGKVKTDDPRVHTTWRTVKLDGAEYPVCNRHFPAANAKSSEYKRAHKIVLRKLKALHQQQTPLGEQSAYDLALDAMRDQHPVTVKTTIAEAWTLVAALQLTTRHPELGEPLRQRIEGIGRKFQHAIIDVHPEVAGIIEASWNPERDVSTK